MRRRNLFLILGFALVAVLGYWLAGTAAPPKIVRTEEPKREAGPKRMVIHDEPAPRFRKGERAPTFRLDDEATEAGALPGQRILVFNDKAALEAFFKRAGDSVRLLGRLDALNALKIGFLDYDDLASLLDGQEQTSLVYPVDIPAPTNGTA